MAHQHTERPLQGMKVLVTRPVRRAAGLCRMIEQAGGTALHFAAIEITAPADTSSREYARDHIAEFTIAVFISPTAVEQTLAFLDRLPPAIRIAAIGSRTAGTLEAMGLTVAVMPDGHDSESLLQHPAMQPEQVAGKKIVIFKGEGGRELLSDTLQSRGATVFCADMYRREPPPSGQQLDRCLSEADLITVSSNEGLQNLYDLAADKKALVRQPLVVPGERALTLAKTLGFSNIHMADNATDQACLEALVNALAELSKKQ